jgi:membrane protein implicated in regulation of membrane protease activity
MNEALEERVLGSVYTRAPGAPEAAEGACSGVTCATLDAVSTALVLAWAFAFALVVVATVVHLRRAHGECERERDRLLAERRAFERFARRVDAVEAVEPTGVEVGGATATMRSASEGDGLSTVVSAYRETVMGVDHFESDYDEALRENMAAELGPDVATAVLDGRVLHPQLKVAIVRKCREAHGHRTGVLQNVDDETAELGAAGEELRRVQSSVERLDRDPLLEKSFEELREEYETLGDLATDCEAVVEDRQSTVTGRDPSPGADEGHDFHAYLYEPLDVSYPVLAAGVSTLTTVRSARRRVLDSLTRRV